MPVEIEKDKVAVPSAEKYPWSKMEVDESFKIPKRVKISSMYTMASRNGRRLKRKFKVSAKQRRVWRIA